MILYGKKKKKTNFLHGINIMIAQHKLLLINNKITYKIFLKIIFYYNTNNILYITIIILLFLNVVILFHTIIIN